MSTPTSTDTLPTLPTEHRYVYVYANGNGAYAIGVHAPTAARHHRTTHAGTYPTRSEALTIAGTLTRTGDTLMLLPSAV